MYWWNHICEAEVLLNERQTLSRKGAQNRYVLPRKASMHPPCVQCRPTATSYTYIVCNNGWIETGLIDEWAPPT